MNPGGIVVGASALLANIVLEPAIRLCRALGYVEVPLRPTEYERVNIKMILELEEAR